MASSNVAVFVSIIGALLCLMAAYYAWKKRKNNYTVDKIMSKMSC